MSRSADDGTEDLATDLAAVRRDIARLAETISVLVQQQAQAAGHRVSEAVGDARDNIASRAVDAQNRVRAAGGEIEACIERNPLTAVLIALGVGLSLGLLSRSRD